MILHLRLQHYLATEFACKFIGISVNLLASIHMFWQKATGVLIAAKWALRDLFLAEKGDMLLVFGEREDAITRLTDSYVAIWITLRSILLIILLIVTVMSHVLRFFPVVIILLLIYIIVICKGRDFLVRSSIISSSIILQLRP